MILRENKQQFGHGESTGRVNFSIRGGKESSFVVCGENEQYGLGESNGQERLDTLF